MLPTEPSRRRVALDRSMPLTHLPAAVAALDPSTTVAVFDGLEVPRLDPRVVDEVIRPAIEPAVERVIEELDRLPGPDVRGGALERHIRAAVELALRQFAGIVETGHPEIDTELYRDLGRKHAQSGLPLQELTGLFSRGGLAVWRTLLELADEGKLPERLLRPASEAVYAFVQELSSAAVEGYARAVSADGAAARSRRVELARLLLRGESDHRQLAAHARDVGWQLPERLEVVLVRTTGAWFEAVSDVPTSILSAPQGAHWCLLVPADVTLPRWGTQVQVAVGPEVPWRRAGESLRVAERLLSLDARAEGTEDGSASWRTVSGDAVELLLRSEPLVAQTLVTQLLGPLVALPARRREPLLETLDAWLLQPGQHTTLAAELHVAARTVRYRVDRLRELLGAVVDDPSRRLELLLAVRAARSGLRSD